MPGILTRAHERAATGNMIHSGVKKLGRIPDGGGWRADPKQSARNHNWNLPESQAYRHVFDSNQARACLGDRRGLGRAHMDAESTG